MPLLAKRWLVWLAVAITATATSAVLIYLGTAFRDYLIGLDVQPDVAGFFGLFAALLPLLVTYVVYNEQEKP